MARDDNSSYTLREARFEIRPELGSSQYAGNRRHALAAFFENLKHDLDMKGRWEHAHKLLHEHTGAVSDLFSWDDPRPALGVLYPLAVFMKNGKVNTELLVS